MFPNLNAEQARRGMTDEMVAAAIGMKRAAYNRKKLSGRFLVDESLKLCKVFNCNFEYLFSTDDTRTA